MQIEQKFIQRATQAILKGPVVLTDVCGFRQQLVDRAEAFAASRIPEVLFVGSTNVGKSSLLSGLLNPAKSPKPTPQKPRDLPHTSKTKGFTKTLNFYTINNLVRLVDSPGYGYKSTGGQGQIMNEYLQNYAENLRSVFILAHAVKGLAPNDVVVAQMLMALGIPFDVVLTKSDRCKNLGAAVKGVEEEMAANRAIVGDVICTSSKTGQGVDLLRGSIWRATEL